MKSSSLFDLLACLVLSELEPILVLSVLFCAKSLALIDNSKNINRKILRTTGLNITNIKDEFKGTKVKKQFYWQIIHTLN